MKLKRKPNGMFYIDTEIPDGTGGLKRSRVSFDTKDTGEAEAQLVQWKLGTHPKHPNQGSVIAPKGWSNGSSGQTVASKGMTVERLLNMCWDDPAVWKNVRSQKTVKSNIKLLSERIGDLNPKDVTSDTVAELVLAMSDRYAPASIQRKLAMLQTALRAGRTYKFEGAPVVDVLPVFPKITANNLKDRVLSEHEEKVMFECIDARHGLQPAHLWWHYRWYIRLLLVTGFRRGEGLSLGPASVKKITKGDRTYTTLVLNRYQTKNGKPHEVPVPQDVVDIIPALDAQASGGKWFALEGKLWERLITIKGDCKAKGVDIDDVGLHTMRHTCITRLARSGKLDLLRLSRWANHSNVSITAKRYAHLLSHDLVDGLSVFE